MEKNITDEQLFTFFRGKASAQETRDIEDWYAKSEDNRKKYWDTHRFYDAYLMNVKLELLEGHPEAPAGLQKRKRTFRIMGIGLGNVAAVVLFCILGFNIISNRLENRLAETMNTIVVPAGKSMDYILPDGTSIRLNSGARLSFPMAFAKDSRKVSLDGEAYFDVAHNPEQPFIVTTFASDIKVLGTKFNVNANEARGTFTTALVDGCVRLVSRITPGKELVMRPGQTISLVDGEFVKDNRSVRNATLWTNGIVSFTVTDFQTLVEQLETSFGAEIIIERDTMPEVDFLQGEFCIHDGIECVLNVLKQSVGFTYTKDYRTGTIHIK